MWHRYSIVSHFHQRVIWIDAYFFSGTGLGSTDELSQSAARVFCFTATAFDLYWLSSNNCGEEFNPRVAARSFCYLWFQTFLCLSLRPSGTSLHFHRAFCKEIIFFSSNYIDSSDCERYLFVVADCPFTAGKECENTLEITLCRSRLCQSVGTSAAHRSWTPLPDLARETSRCGFEFGRHCFTEAPRA